MQLVLVVWFLITGRLELPWKENKTVCDTLGNCFNAGSWLPTITFTLSWISLAVKVVDIYQGKPQNESICNSNFEFSKVWLRQTQTEEKKANKNLFV